MFPLLWLSSVTSLQAHFAVFAICCLQSSRFGLQRMEVRTLTVGYSLFWCQQNSMFLVSKCDLSVKLTSHDSLHIHGRPAPKICEQFRSGSVIHERLNYTFGYDLKQSYESCYKPCYQYCDKSTNENDYQKTEQMTNNTLKNKDMLLTNNNSKSNHSVNIAESTVKHMVKMAANENNVNAQNVNVHYVKNIANRHTLVKKIFQIAVYVPLLLRLSNDVEENPGPRTINHIVDPTYTVHADFNQGNELMFGMNAGKQCVAMSLCAIVYKEIKSVNIWDKLMLNSILISGNSLYSMISQSINKSYLLLTDVPEYVDIDNRAFNLQYSNSFSGALCMSEDNLPHVTLEHALNEVLFSLHYNSCLLTIGMNTVAIIMPFSGVFKVFDSHSRDVFGGPCALGYCVLVSVEGVENLGEYFRLTSMSNVVILFELKGVTCIATELSASSCITKSGMVHVGSTEVFEQQDVNSKRSNTKKIRKQNESTEQREARLAKMREYNISRRQNETAEQRKARLAKERERKRARKRAFSQKQGETEGKCSSHPIEQGTSHPVSNYFPNENINELALVRKFHNSVSAGPLYICTCCDQ